MHLIALFELIAAVSVDKITIYKRTEVRRQDSEWNKNEGIIWKAFCGTGVRNEGLGCPKYGRLSGLFCWRRLSKMIWTRKKLWKHCVQRVSRMRVLGVQNTASCPVYSAGAGCPKWFGSGKSCENIVFNGCPEWGYWVSKIRTVVRLILLAQTVQNDLDTREIVKPLCSEGVQSIGVGQGIRPGWQYPRPPRL